MVLLRKYQLDIVFLFFALSAILWSAFALMKQWGADPHEYEWFIAGPVIMLYGIMLWHIRSHIKKQEFRHLTTKTVVYWIIFGILLFASYQTPLPAAEYWSLELMFILFTCFLADSYWDFRELRWKKLFTKKEMGK